MNLLEVVGKPVDSSYCLIKIGGTAIVTTTGTKDIDLSSSIEDYVYTLDNIPVSEKIGVEIKTGVKANVRLNIDTSASISSDGVEAKIVGLGFKVGKLTGFSTPLGEFEINFGKMFG
ncbi:hypothetical protein RhiirA5_409388 [Rhizophagus irregularis]|uniref:Uncharacterized protein n=1 Tax=Rhizophagus irregularis TaxID=588596 RepID=A0A2I1E1E2_9GLOM|nr:hypothetical protein RhiirA5_409388 [Rhizophagus irregularis]PKC73607.1 hypothetical protein RhiirA1_450966 [Rhizophagus irregularis]PKY15915.1 hypothetical protein RhiirB3_428190 [Rhizophagus irregularis]